MHKLDLDSLREALNELVEKELGEAQKLRESLHQNPCLSGQEGPATKRLADEIPSDFSVVADTGGIGRIGPEGAAVAVRAEMDALPGTENTGASFASTNGAMHACGHDVHQAALVAFTRAAGKLELPFAIVPFMQPREETYPSGAYDFMESRVFETEDVAVVIGAHVHPRIAVGATATGTAPINAAADECRIEVQGEGGHGAYPHEAKNPITVLAQILVGIPEVVRRTISPMNPATISFGKIGGGEAANVIPASAHALATLRTMTEADRQTIREAITHYVVLQAESFGVEARVTFTSGEPVLENDPELVPYIDMQLQKLGIEVSQPMRSLGADDFSFYGEKYPSVMAFVGVETAGADPQPSLHSPEFLPSPRAVADVAKTLVAAYVGACGYLLNRGKEVGDTP